MTGQPLLETKASTLTLASKRFINLRRNLFSGRDKRGAYGLVQGYMLTHMGDGVCRPNTPRLRHSLKLGCNISRPQLVTFIGLRHGSPLVCENKELSEASRSLL